MITMRFAARGLWSWDGATASTLLFGGFDGNPTRDVPLDDTWAYVGD